MAVNVPRNTAVRPDVLYINALLVPLTANRPSASASRMSIVRRSLPTSTWMTVTTQPAMSAVSTDTLSEMPTGGTAPSKMSRMMPPPNAVSHAVMMIANTSYCLRIAARPPTRPQQKMARYSTPWKNGELCNATSIPAPLRMPASRRSVSKRPGPTNPPTS